VTPQEQLAEFVARQRMTFALVDEESKSKQEMEVLERSSGKSMTFAPGAITKLEEARDGIQGSRYLRICLDDGRNFAMAGVGFVFAPSFVSTGPLTDCPPTACMMDFDKLFHHLKHLVDEADQGRGQEAMQVLMILLAYLDGARAIGLDISPEERRVEAQLEKLESRGHPVS
jgi:hypothetical protein